MQNNVSLRASVSDALLAVQASKGASLDVAIWYVRGNKRTNQILTSGKALLRMTS